MVEVHYVSGAVWVLCGLAILGLGFLIAFRGRADLHSDYRESVDPAYVSRWAGAIAFLMGIVTVAFGVREMVFGWDPAALGALLVILLVLSYLTKLIARGWTPR